MENYPRWAEKHSVNCYFCGFLVDERECANADNYNDNDGGSICQNCLKGKYNEDTKLQGPKVSI